MAKTAPAVSMKLVPTNAGFLHRILQEQATDVSNRKSPAAQLPRAAILH